MGIDDKVRECFVLFDQGQYHDAIFVLVEGAKFSMACHSGWVDGGIRDAVSEVFSRVMRLVETYETLERWDDIYARMMKLDQGLRCWNDAVHPAYRMSFTPEQEEMFRRSQENLSGDPFEEI
ncbi:MAG: hypothetical protein AABX47_06025 [Nanoarchaeota archaeon]